MVKAITPFFVESGHRGLPWNTRLEPDEGRTSSLIRDITPALGSASSIILDNVKCGEIRCLLRKAGTSLQPLG